MSGHATQNLYVDVDDVDEHYARAVKAGATIIEEPKDTFYGARRYGAEDLEGHRWYFAQDLTTSARKPAKKTARRKTHGAARRRTRAAANDRHVSDEERRMRRIRYSVAMSLDGYIAGPERRVRLDRARSERGRGVLQGVLRAVRHRAHGAQELRASRRRRLAVQDLRRCHARYAPGKHGDVTVLGGDALERIAALREEPGKDIWLWGGGELFGSLAAAGLVDTVEIGVVPVLLGAGRKVMAGCSRRVKLVQRPPDLELPGHTLLVYDVEKRAA